MSKDGKKEISTENMTRLTPVMIYKILREESSEDHPLTTGYILKRLEEQGIKITRQTMYKDIDLLQKMDFDIITNRSRSNEYYLEQDDFNVGEQRILLDAISAARFIPENKSKELVYKVACLNGQANAQDLMDSMMHFTNMKYDDSNIYYYINNITKAIEDNRKITFYYFDYNEKKQKKYRKDKQPYIENPVGTVCSNNNYYILVYNEKYDKIINYRIDRMDRVDIYNEERKLPLDVEKRTQEYLDSQFSMFAGEKTTVWIQSTKQHINSILDMFGNAVHFQAAPDGYVRFRAQVQLAPTFYSWIAGFGGDMEIVGPNTAIDKFCDFLNANLSKYASRLEKLSRLNVLRESNKSALYSKIRPSRDLAEPGPERRRPGRPRKVQETDSTDNMVMAEDAAATEMPPRRRGRPRTRWTEPAKPNEPDKT